MSECRLHLPATDLIEFEAQMKRGEAHGAGAGHIRWARKAGPAMQRCW